MIVYCDATGRQYTIPISYSNDTFITEGTIRSVNDMGAGVQSVYVCPINSNTIHVWLDWYPNAGGCNISVICLGY